MKSSAVIIPACVLSYTNNGAVVTHCVYTQESQTIIRLNHALPYQLGTARLCAVTWLKGGGYQVVHVCTGPCSAGSGMQCAQCTL